MKATIYPDADGWRWVLTGMTDETICGSRPYVSREDAQYDLDMLFGRPTPVEVIVRNHSDKVITNYHLRPHAPHDPGGITI